MTDIIEQLEAFRQRVTGTIIRGQRVSDVELTIDSLGDPYRYFVSVFFFENPPSNQSLEMNMLERVFSEIPDHAFYLADTRAEAEAVLAGTVSPAWVLADEMPPKPKKAKP